MAATATYRWRLAQWTWTRPSASTSCGRRCSMPHERGCLSGTTISPSTCILPAPATPSCPSKSQLGLVIPSPPCWRRRPRLATTLSSSSRDRCLPLPAAKVSSIDNESSARAGLPLHSLFRSFSGHSHALVVCCPVCLCVCVCGCVCVCSAASSSALPARQIEELTTAIIAGLSARQEETIAGLKADLEEKLDTVEEKLAAEQEETRNAVRELQARQGQTADSPPSHPHAAALALPPLTSAAPLALLLCMGCAV